MTVPAAWCGREWVVEEWPPLLFPLALPWQRLKEKAVNAKLTEAPG